MKNTNLVRIGKVSFFDLGVSRKSPPLWHFLAVFPALNAVDAEPAALTYHLMLLPRHTIPIGWRKPFRQRLLRLLINQPLGTCHDQEPHYVFT